MRGGWGDWGCKRRFAACRVSCGLPRFLRPSGRSQRLRGGVLGCEGHAALCNLPRFLRPSGRSQRLRRAGRWGVGYMRRFATCRVSCGLWAARNACAVRGGVLGGAVHAAFCNLPRFLRPLGRSQCLRGWGALGRAVHAALCGIPRFLRPLGRSQRLRGWGGVRYMPRFAACRVSCGLWAARNACFLCCGTGIWGAAPNPGKGLRPLHPALLSPYLTTRFLSLRKSSVTPSGGSPNVALSVLLPPSHVSCIAISLASIRQPSSTTVTTSPTS